MDTQQRSILLWLRDTIPSIREKVFGMADIPLDIETEHNEMIHTYLEHKSTLLPTQEELKQFINEHHVCQLQIHYNIFYDAYGILSTYKDRNPNGSYYEYILHTNGTYCSNNGLNWNNTLDDNIFLYPSDSIRYFKKKSLDNNGWIKKYNPNYVLEMTIKYVNYILDDMELYMKIAYLYKFLNHMYFYENFNIELVSNIKATEEHYNILYAIVIEYIKDNS